MRVLILGIDGYIGWPLAMHLAGRGHRVQGIDNLSRRGRVLAEGGQSAFSLPAISERARRLGIAVSTGSVGPTEDDTLVNVLAAFHPEVIVHLAEQPSAPWSMRSEQNCQETVRENLASTLAVLWAMREWSPGAHLVKLASMGEYGTPGVDIPEGWFDLEFRGRSTRALFPRSPGSFYHASKAADSLMVEMACRTWGLASTDIMQGVVYGTRTPEMGDPVDPALRTRFDFDQCFGTVINRFCTQAVLGLPIRPYGGGGQIRGYLPLVDSIQCLRIITESPPSPGRYRVVNQFEEVSSVLDLAYRVSVEADVLGLSTSIICAENPRLEAENHHYAPDHEILASLGYSPTCGMSQAISHMIQDLLTARERLEEASGAIDPTVRWG